MRQKLRKVLAVVLVLAMTLPAMAFAESNGHLTRGEAIEWINASLGLSEKGNVSFKDIRPGDVYYEAVAVAEKAGYLKGYMDKTVRVNQKLKREEVAVLLVNAYGLKGKGTAQPIADINKASEWAREALVLAVHYELLALDGEQRVHPHRLMEKSDWVLPVKEKAWVRGDADLAVTGLTLVSQGEGAISDNQLGFYPPAKVNQAPDGFDGWLMMYSKSDLDAVWSHVRGLKSDEVMAYAKTDGENRMYRISNFAWADGLGNTFRSNQKDVVTGGAFDTGVYHFYVGVYVSGEVVSLVKCETSLDVKPVPKNITWAFENDGLSVAFESSSDPRVDGFVVFYTTESRYGLFETNAFDLNKALEEKRAVRFPADARSGLLPFSIKDMMSGQALGEDVYNLFVMTVSKGEVFGIGMAKKAVVTAPVPEPNNESIGSGVGTILAAGGATSSSEAAQKPFYEFIRQAAGGGRPRIAILSSSRDALSVVENHYFYKDPVYGSLEDNFTDLGFEPIYIPLAIDNMDVAEDPYWAGLLRTADAVFLQGGDQAKHARTLIRENGQDTLMLEAMRSVYERGGMIAGTSAGLHVMSDPVMGYGLPDVALLTNASEWIEIKDIPKQNDVAPSIDNNTILHKGLGLVPETLLLDSHFDARGRLGRLIVAMRDAGKTIGIGADEGTGIAIQVLEGLPVGQVIGLRGIFIVDASAASFSEAGQGKPFEARDLVVHYLRAGDAYNFATGQVIWAKERVDAAPTPLDMGSEYGLFDGDYGATKAILAFIDSGLMTHAFTEKTGHVVTFERMDGPSVKMSVSLPMAPLEAIEVSVGKADGSGGAYAATIAFSAPLKVGYVGSKGSYLNDLEAAEHFVSLKRGGALLEQGSSSLMIVSGRFLEIVAKTADFESGDLLVLHDTITGANGIRLSRETSFVYDGKKWTLMD